MNRLQKSCLLGLSLYSAFSLAASPLDAYIGKWADPDYGCQDEDGMGAIYIDHEKAGYRISGYELDLRAKKTIDKGDSLKIVGQSIGAHDDLSNGETAIFTLGKIHQGKNARYTSTDGGDTVQYFRCKK